MVWFLHVIYGTWVVIKKKKVFLKDQKITFYMVQYIYVFYKAPWTLHLENSYFEGSVIAHASGVSIEWPCGMIYYAAKHTNITERNNTTQSFTCIFHLKKKSQMFYIQLYLQLFALYSIECKVECM